MSFFGDDSFDDIVRELMGQGSPRTTSSRRVVRSEKEERIVDYIEDEDYIYFVFELPGYVESDLDVVVSKDEVSVNAIKKNTEGVQSYLMKKLTKGLSFKKAIPVKVKTKKYEQTFRNGILEVKFPRK